MAGGRVGPERRRAGRQFQGGSGVTGARADGPAPPYASAWTAPIALGGPDRQFGALAPVVGGRHHRRRSAPSRSSGVDAARRVPASWSVDRDLGPPVPAGHRAAVRDGSAVVYTEGFGDGPPDAAARRRRPPRRAPRSRRLLGDGADTGDGPFDSHLAAIDLRTQEPLWEPVAARRREPDRGHGRGRHRLRRGPTAARSTRSTSPTGKVAWTADAGPARRPRPLAASGRHGAGRRSRRRRRRDFPRSWRSSASDGRRGLAPRRPGRSRDRRDRRPPTGRPLYVGVLGEPGRQRRCDRPGDGLDAVARPAATRPFDPSATASPVDHRRRGRTSLDALGSSIALDPADRARAVGLRAQRARAPRPRPSWSGATCCVGTADGARRPRCRRSATSCGDGAVRGGALRALAVTGRSARRGARRRRRGTGRPSSHDPDGALVAGDFAHDAQTRRCSRSTSRRRVAVAGARRSCWAGSWRGGWALRSPIVKAPTTTTTTTTTPRPIRRGRGRRPGDQQEQEAPAERLSSPAACGQGRRAAPQGHLRIPCSRRGSRATSSMPRSGRRCGRGFVAAVASPVLVIGDHRGPGAALEWLVAGRARLQGPFAIFGERARRSRRSGTSFDVTLVDRRVRGAERACSRCSAFVAVRGVDPGGR